MLARSRWFIFAVVAALAAPALAQSTLEAPVGQYVPYALDTGAWKASDLPGDVAYAAEVQVPGAAWLRIFFSEVVLGPGSTVRMTSLLDNEVQELDAAGLAMWSSSSAYFNGDTILLELITAPGSGENRLVIDRLEMEVAHDIGIRGGSGQCGICSADDRAPSVENWACRLMSIGCSATVYTTDSCLVSAGHCISGSLVAQFNVPNSQSNCNTVNPPVNDQFPVTAQNFLNAGVGADWAVLRTGTNGLGQRPFQRYGLLRRIAPGANAIGDAVSMNGYGLDLTCTRSQTQQLSTGALTNITSTSYQFNADVRGGNSGSSLIHNGRIIAIVTHCQTNCPNHGTRMTVPAFVTARNTTCVNCNPDTNGDRVIDLSDLSVVLGVFGTCYPAAGFNPAADVNADNCVNLSDLSIILASFGLACP